VSGWGGTSCREYEAACGRLVGADDAEVGAPDAEAGLAHVLEHLERLPLRVDFGLPEQLNKNKNKKSTKTSQQKHNH